MTTRAASEIVIGPVITERTYQLYTQGRYTFKVSATASKTEIKKALEEQYETQNIKVRDINTVSMRGKKRRSFRRTGAGSVGKTDDDATFMVPSPVAVEPSPRQRFEASTGKPAVKWNEGFHDG